jgi:hydroxypyruvate isomerase
MSIKNGKSVQVHRRDFVKGAAGIAAAGAAGIGSASLLRASEPVISKGRINQSIAYWCFNVAGEKWDVVQQCQVAKQLGCKSVELVDHEDFRILKKQGLVCAISPNGMPGAPFMTGLNNPRYQDEVITRTMKAIDLNADAGCPSVIAFNGYKWHDAEDENSGEIPKDEGASNCVKALKKLAAHAEKKGVTVCLEQLNTRDDTHPMKGHPGYQGDHIDYVADIVKAVGSPNVKLLFDIYHVQVMDGDIIRRIKQYHELIGHVHTAGNPGRCEIDAEQEINFAACMKALLDVGYSGYVGHEYIPTRDAMSGLTNAVKLCDV